MPIILLYLLSQRLVVRHQWRQRSGDASVSVAGIILGGWCISALTHLSRVDYEGGYRGVLRFYTSVYGQSSKTTSITEVPVPAERHAEAEQLAREFRKAP